MITTETLQILIWSATGGLTAVSVVAMAVLGVFSPRPLLLAPPRHSALSLLHVGGVLALYLFAEIVALMLTGYKGPGKGEAVAIGQVTHAQAVDAAVRMLLVGLMVALGGRLTHGGLEGWGFSRRRLGGGIGQGVLAALLIAAPIFLVMQATDLVDQALHRQTPIHEVLKILEMHPPMATKALLIFSAAVVAPLAEELFFRGILQTALMQRNPLRLGLSAAPAAQGFPLYPGMPPAGADAPPASPARRWVAILISAALFTLMHGQVEFFPVLMVLAVGLGYLYERTGNLWAAVTLHAAFNSTMLVLTLYP